jgi:hypothetical protein
MEIVEAALAMGIEPRSALFQDVQAISLLTQTNHLPMQ